MLTEDPNDPGTYLIQNPPPVQEDPGDPGFFLNMPEDPNDPGFFLSED